MKRMILIVTLLVTGGLSGTVHGAQLDLDLRSNEPTIAVNPTNSSNVVAANFDQGRQRLKISTDGGASFPFIVSAALPAGQTFFQGDDSLAFDAQGRLFWSYLTNGSPAGPNVVVQQVDSINISLVGLPHFVATSNLDKAWIAADANPLSPFANNLYAVWTDFNVGAAVRFARSNDQGVTWTTMAGNMSGPGEGFTWPPEVAVGRNGDVYAAWHVNTGGTTGGVRMRRSTDGGVTFGSELFPFPDGTAAVTTNGATGVANKIAGMHMWLQGAVQPRILIDPVRPNTLYIICANDPDGVFNPLNDPSDIVLARSTDNGATWTRSTISQGVSGDSEIMPSAAISASGAIAVSWYDNRRHLTVADSLGGTHFLLDVFTTISIDGGLTFSVPVQLNSQSFDPELQAPDRFGNHTLRIGEYNGLSIGGSFAHAVWTGNRATPATQGTFYDRFVVPAGVVNSSPVLTVPGPQSVDFHDFLTFNVSATDADAGDTLTFSATGLPAGLTLTDNGNRTATVSGTVTAQPGLYTATITVDDHHNPPVSKTVAITVTREETTTKYTGPLVIANGFPVTLSGQLLEDGVTPIAGRTLTLSVGTNSCTAGPSNASGNASCTIPVVSVPFGPVTVKADFAGDLFYLPSSDTQTATVFAFPSRGDFVLGNVTVSGATPTTDVTFWGSQWSSRNVLSGGAAPAQFKGFAEVLSSTPPTCGGTWTASAGNSVTPVSAPLPSYMGVLVSSAVSKSGNTISGNVTKIVVVTTNPGYDADPGHPGTGAIVATYCQ